MGNSLPTWKKAASSLACLVLLTVAHMTAFVVINEKNPNPGLTVFTF